MTLVTTSRRSTPVIRSIAKDLAFATGATYLARGKHGLREIAEDHDTFIVIEQKKPGILMTLHDNGEPCLCRIIRNFETGVRDGPLQRGIRTSDKDLGSYLESSCPVQYLEDTTLILTFDGPQKRCMNIVLSPGVVHEA